MIGGLLFAFSSWVWKTRSTTSFSKLVAVAAVGNTDSAFKKKVYSIGLNIVIDFSTVLLKHSLFTFFYFYLFLIAVAQVEDIPIGMLLPRSWFWSTLRNTWLERQPKSYQGGLSMLQSTECSHFDYFVTFCSIACDTLGFAPVIIASWQLSNNCQSSCFLHVIVICIFYVRLSSLLKSLKDNLAFGDK